MTIVLQKLNLLLLLQSGRKFSTTLLPHKFCPCCQASCSISSWTSTGSRIWILQHTCVWPLCFSVILHTHSQVTAHMLTHSSHKWCLTCVAVGQFCPVPSAVWRGKCSHPNACLLVSDRLSSTSGPTWQLETKTYFWNQTQGDKSQWHRFLFGKNWCCKRLLHEPPQLYLLCWRFLLIQTSCIFPWRDVLSLVHISLGEIGRLLLDSQCFFLWCDFWLWSEAQHLSLCENHCFVLEHLA